MMESNAIGSPLLRQLFYVTYTWHVVIWCMSQDINCTGIQINASVQKFCICSRIVHAHTTYFRENRSRYTLAQPMSRKEGASLQKDVPWRASSASKPIPIIHRFPILCLPQNSLSDYTLSVMKVGRHLLFYLLWVLFLFFISEVHSDAFAGGVLGIIIEMVIELCKRFLRSRWTLIIIQIITKLCNS